MRGRGRCSGPAALCWRGAFVRWGARSWARARRSGGPGLVLPLGPAVPAAPAEPGLRPGSTLHRGTRPHQRPAGKPHGRRPQPARRRALCVNTGLYIFLYCVFIHSVPPAAPGRRWDRCGRLQQSRASNPRPRALTAGGARREGGAAAPGPGRPRPSAPPPRRLPRGLAGGLCTHTGPGQWREEGA